MRWEGMAWRCNGEMKERLCLSLLVSLWKSGPAGWVRKCGMGDPDEPEHTLAPSAKTAIEDASLAGGGGDDELLLLLPAAATSKQARCSNVQACSRCGVKASSRVWMHTL